MTLVEKNKKTIKGHTFSLQLFTPDDRAYQPRAKQRGSSQKRPLSNSLPLPGVRQSRSSKRLRKGFGGGGEEIDQPDFLNIGELDDDNRDTTKEDDEMAKDFDSAPLIEGRNSTYGLKKIIVYKRHTTVMKQAS